MEQDQAPRPRGRQGGRKPALTPQQITEACALWDSRTMTLRDIAERFGVSPSTIHRHVTRKEPA